MREAAQGCILIRPIRTFFLFVLLTLGAGRRLARHKRPLTPGVDRNGVFVAPSARVPKSAPKLPIRRHARAKAGKVKVCSSVRRFSFP
jgi:hypothetical protein